MLSTRKEQWVKSRGDNGVTNAPCGWLNARRDDVFSSISAKQPLGFVGASLVEMSELCEAVSANRLTCNYEICVCNCGDLVGEKSSGRIFYDKLLNDIGRMVDVPALQNALAVRRASSTELTGFRDAYEYLGKELLKSGRSILLIVADYEKLLALPQMVRHEIIGGPLFAFCDDTGPRQYNTSTVFSSGVPLWWCEYDEDPVYSSVVYQRTIDYIVRKPDGHCVENTVRSLPSEDRDEFLRKTGLRMEPIL